MEPSLTAYDDSFRTLLNDCRELIIPVVNEAFGENYTGREEIIFSSNEHFISQEGGNEEKRITDSSFIIVGADGVRRKYHIECQALQDSSMLVRMFEYDTQIALDDGVVEKNVFTVTFPKSAIIFLRHGKETPDTMLIRMITPGGTAEYTVPVVKVQMYSLDSIFDKKLLFFIPFYIFSHEKQLPAYESDETKLKKLTAEYAYIRSRLEELQKAGEITEFEKRAICDMTNHVLALIAQRYDKVREGVEHIMGGKILDYEAKAIKNEGISIGFNRGLNRGFNKGRKEGRKEGRDEGIDIGFDRGMQKAKAETEERAKDMLRDKMSLSLVKKYTHLSMTRIEELARGLGML